MHCQQTQTKVSFVIQKVTIISNTQGVVTKSRSIWPCNEYETAITQYMYIYNRVFQLGQTALYTIQMSTEACSS